MAINVRCAGKFAAPKVFYGEHEVTGVTVTTTGIPVAPSCGWKGERYAMGKLTPNQERELRPLSPEWFRACVDADQAVQTAKPCPRCGGRVELISQGGAA